MLTHEWYVTIHFIAGLDMFYERENSMHGSGRARVRLYTGFLIHVHIMQCKLQLIQSILNSIYHIILYQMKSEQKIHATKPILIK